MILVQTDLDVSLVSYSRTNGAHCFDQTKSDVVEKPLEFGLTLLYGNTSFKLLLFTTNK